MFIKKKRKNVGTKYRLVTESWHVHRKRHMTFKFTTVGTPNRLTKFLYQFYTHISHLCSACYMPYHLIFILFTTLIIHMKNTHKETPRYTTISTVLYSSSRIYTHFPPLTPSQVLRLKTQTKTMQDLLLLQGKS